MNPSTNNWRYKRIEHHVCGNRSVHHNTECRRSYHIKRDNSNTIIYHLELNRVPHLTKCKDKTDLSDVYENYVVIFVCVKFHLTYT